MSLTVWPKVTELERWGAGTDQSVLQPGSHVGWTVAHSAHVSPFLKRTAGIGNTLIISQVKDMLEP